MAMKNLRSSIHRSSMRMPCFRFESGRHEASHPDVQASRWILSLAHKDDRPSRPQGRYRESVERSKSQAGAEVRRLSFPLDRNNAAYGTPAYLKIYREQLRELLTQYGPIHEVWHDGANGGDGYYGGAKEKRTIDKRVYYDWPQTWELVRSLQPDAVIFSDMGPDLRWVGNEKGYANETCWETYDPVGPDGGAPAPGFTRDKEGQAGTRNGSHWMPPECDVSIRPGWFWHEKENEKVKTPRQLMDLYYRRLDVEAACC